MDKVKNFLLANIDEEYREFTLPLIPNIDKDSFLGVRLPLLKKFAKELSESERAKFMDYLPHHYHEENVLHSLILSSIKDYDLFMKRVDEFLPFVNNWAVCDSVCNKHLEKHKDKLIKEIYKWLKSNEVYRVRYAIKCLMSYYLDKSFSTEHLKKVEQVTLDDYYVKMMIAWYIATGLAKNYEDFIKPIEEKSFDVFIHNKAIQKAVESYRVSDEHKVYLKSLKRK